MKNSQDVAQSRKTLRARFQRNASYIGLFSVLSYAVDYSFQLVDTFWVARMGTGAATALSLVTAFIYVVMALNEIVGVSSVAMLSQADGRGEPDEFSRLFWIFIVLKGAMGILFATVFWISIRYGINLLTLDPSVKAYTIEYASVIWLSLIIVPVYSTVMTTLRITGRSALGAVLSCAAFLANLLLVPTLAFGLWHFPGLGIAGAAWATVLAQGAILLIGAAVILTGKFGAAMRKPRLAIAGWPHIGRLIWIGVPVGGVMLIANLEQAAILGIVAQHPADVSDGLSIANRLFGFIYMVNFGVAAGIAITVGQFIGAGNGSTIENSLPGFATMAAGIVSFLSFILATAAGPVVGLFTVNDLAIETARSYLWFMVLVSAANCCFLVYSGVYEGLGKNWPVFFAAVAGHVFLEGSLLFGVVMAGNTSLSIVWIIVTTGAIAAASLLVMMCHASLRRLQFAL